MANIKLSRKENNPESNFFVDESCIDCGTCYWVAPNIFKRFENQSIAFNNNSSEEENIKGYEALLSCPTNSIGKNKKVSFKETFPRLIEDDVFHLGFHSERSFGGTPYYIKNFGGVMIDSPRYNPRTVKHLESFGGLRYQLLTHKDGIADTDLYAKKFKSKRMIHKEDSCLRSKNWENYFQGFDDIKIENDLIAIPTPGHTKGSVCYLYKNKFLFTGDHLCFSRNLNQLIGFKNHCWFSLKELIISMEKLLNYSFTWILPEHDSPFFAPPDQMKKELHKCIKFLKS